MDRDQGHLDRQLPPETTYELQQLLKIHKRQPILTLTNFRQLQKGYGYKWEDSSANVKEPKGGGLA
jgi:hypothetical protein